MKFKTKLASSGSKEGIIKLISKFYCMDSIEGIELVVTDMTKKYIVYDVVKNEKRLVTKVLEKFSKSGYKFTFGAGLE